MKRVWIVAVIVLSLAMGVSAQSVGDLVKLSKEGNFAEIIKQAPAVVAKSVGRDKYLAQRLHATALVETGKVEEGIKMYEDIIKAPGVTQLENESIQVRLADILFRNAKRPEDALAKYRTLVTAENPEARVKAKQGVGKVLWQQKKYAESVTAYEAALKDEAATTNDKVSCNIWIGRTYMWQLNQPAKAKEPYKQVVLLTDKPQLLAEALNRTKVGAKELVDSLQARAKAPVFKDLLKLAIEKAVTEEGLSTYDHAYCLYKIQGFMVDETVWASELSTVWTRINRLTGIVGVNQKALEDWLKVNK